MTTIGFTGTRYGMTPSQGVAVRILLCNLDGQDFHHGDCVGADSQAHDIAAELDYDIVIHPPADRRLAAGRQAGMILPPRPYLERNRRIVDACDVLIAAPREEVRPVTSGGGTWYTIRYAEHAGRTVHIVWPDGHIDTITGGTP